MKSILKGLRYISQVFESEKEEEIVIGNPTDVKHVAHIGWDGPSSNPNTAPSWMTEFKNSGGSESGEGGGGGDDMSARCMSESGGVRSRDTPKLPKSNRKTASEKGSPTKEKSSDKSKRKTSNKGTTSRKPKEDHHHSEQLDDFASWPNGSRGSPDIQKKSKKKKTKKKTTKGTEGSTRSERISDASNMSDYMSETGSVRSMPHFDIRDDV